MAVFLAGANRYSAAADLIGRLPQLVVETRIRLAITATVQAKQIGITKATLTRLEAGGVPTQPTIIATLRWLAQHP